MKLCRGVFLLFFVTATLLVTGCSKTPPSTPSPEQGSGRITFAGSTTIQPLAGMIGDAFQKQHPNISLEIAAGGSKVGIQAVHDGTADIGMASRALEAEEAEGIKQFKIAVDVIAVVVNSQNPVENISREHLRQVYLGQIVNWKDLGGPDMEIVPVVREETSGTRGAFDELVLEKEIPNAPKMVTAVTAGDVAAQVASNPGTLGYVGFGNIEDGLRAVAIDGVEPSPATVEDESYGLVRPLLLLTGPLSQPLADVYIRFALSDDGQAVVKEHGWIPANSD